jgi:hypothetical protein
MATTETVTDTVTGLVWERGTSAGGMSWQNAKMRCASVHAGGMTGWRLPTLIELESIVEDGQFNSAIDPTAFPGTPSTFFWSSSPYVNVEGDAWVVNFGGGDSGASDVSNGYYTRCVQ